ncbi:MAG: bacillithiol system redox-active protein YtxJ [Gemmatimonadota bacterium]
MRTIQAPDDLQDALSANRAILFKHSTRCELSSSARIHVEKFAENFPAADIFVVDVIRDRRLSNEVESRLGVRHESPQAILVCGGKAIHQASHRGVRLKTLSKWWNESSPDQAW